MHKLKLLGYLDENHNLTTTANNTLIDIESGMMGTKVGRTGLLDEAFVANVAKYRELFPKGVVNGKALRNGSIELTNRMLWFFKTYPQYDWEIVLAATHNYLSTLEDFTYCKTSAYFIKKEDKNKNTQCLLADWCEASLDEDKELASPIVGFNKLV